MSNKELPIPLSRGELTWGNRYLLFELVFLGPLLSFILSLLPRVWVDLNTAYYLVNFIAVICIFHRYLGRSLKLGLHRWQKLLIAAGVGFVVYWVLIRSLDHLIFRLVPQFENPNDAEIIQAVQSRFWITAFGTVVLVPLTEEVLFRGLIFGSIRNKYPIAAYIGSVICFALVHVLGYWGIKPPLQLALSFLQYIPAGLVLAWSYEFSGSILAPTLIHTAVNVIAIISMR